MILRSIQILIFTLSLSSVHASNLKQKIHISIHDARPVTYLDKNTFKGPIIEVIETMLKDLNLEGELHLVPWSRTLNQAKSGFPTLLVRHSMNLERKSYLNPILIGFQTRQVNFLKNKKSNIKIEKFSDLYKYTLGVKRGYFYSNKMNSPGLNKVVVNKASQLVGMLNSSRVDLVVFHELLELKENAKLEKVKFDEEFEIIEFKETFLNPLYFSIPINSDLNKLHKKISCQILKYRESGYFKKVFVEHAISPMDQDFKHSESLSQEKYCKQ